MSRPPKFFMVMRDGPKTDVERPPKFKHETYESAVAEAQRLADKHPEVTFVVMCAVVGFTFTPPVPISPYTKIEFGPPMKPARQPQKETGE